MVRSLYFCLSKEEEVDFGLGLIFLVEGISRVSFLLDGGGDLDLDRDLRLE